MNSLQYVRDSMDVKHTPKGGRTLTVRLHINGKGQLYAIGRKRTPINDVRQRANWLAATRFVVQQIEEFHHLQEEQRP